MANINLKKNEGLVANNGAPITARTWDSGNIDGYSYQALVFPEPSDYGINNGNISKLSIKSPDGKLVASYDRGWDIEPAGKTAKAILDKVLARYTVEQSSETKCNVQESQQETLDSSIKDWYTVEYDTDELGQRIQGTFRGVIQTLLDGGDVYRYVNVDDSIVRERVLEKLSDILGVGYGDLYQLWLKGTASRQLLAKLRRIGFFKERNPESKCNEAFAVYRGGPDYSSSFMIDCGSPERAKALADAIGEEAYGHPLGSAKDDAGRHFLGGEIIQFWPVDRYFTATVDPCDKAIEWCQEFLKSLDGEISALTGNDAGLESNGNEALSPKMQQRLKLKAWHDSTMGMNGFDEAGYAFLDLYDNGKCSSYAVPTKGYKTEKEARDAGKKIFDDFDEYLDVTAYQDEEDSPNGEHMWFPAYRLKKTFVDLPEGEGLDVLSELSDVLYRLYTKGESALTGNDAGLESNRNEGADDILAKHAGDYWYHRYYNSMRRLNLHYKLNGKKQPVLRVGGIDVIHVAHVLGDALAHVHPELKAGAKKMGQLIDTYYKDHSDENAKKFFLNMVKELVPQAFPGIEVLDVTSAWNKDPDGETFL